MGHEIIWCNSSLKHVIETTGPAEKMYLQYLLLFGPGEGERRRLHVNDYR